MLEDMLEERILNSEACFKEILEYVQEEGNERSLDEVENDIFNKLLELGQQLMEVFVSFAAMAECIRCS